MAEVLEFDWFILLLRLAFVFLLYFFLYQIVRVTSRELVELARRSPHAGPSTTPPRLIVVDGADSTLAAGTTFVLRPLTTIGRNPENVIALDEPFVSGRHAELSLDHDRWWVHDHGSTNGTFVNGDRVAGATGIRAGDIVQFGRIKLRFSA
ncbi:MAG: FHA domain-containing protein [Chloroflexota bacterium]|nr:FHA domain-containing protein [Chloroflexota bacterium]